MSDHPGHKMPNLTSNELVALRDLIGASPSGGVLEPLYGWLHDLIGHAALPHDAAFRTSYKKGMASMYEENDLNSYREAFGYDRLEDDNH